MEWGSEENEIDVEEVLDEMVRGLEFLKNNQGSPNEDLLELSEVLVRIAIIIEPFIPGDDGITITRNIQSILSLDFTVAILLHS